MSVRALATFALLLTFGCEPAPELGAGCTRASDCMAPLVCAIGRCRAACADSRDCPTLARCLVEPSSGLGVCSLDRVDSCRAHGCALGFVCVDGECVNECDAIASCPDGVCEGGACVPVRGDAGVRVDASMAEDAGLDASGGARTLTALIADDADDGEISGSMLYPRGEDSLVVDYVGYWNPSGPTRAFLRFTLPEAIPAGATIVDAHVEVMADVTAGLCGPGDFLVVVGANAADAPQPIDANGWPGGPSGGAATTASVTWGPLSDWASGLTSSPDLAPILDELVRTHGGLAAGAHVALWAWADGFTHDGEGSWSDSSRVDQDPQLVVRFVP